MSLYEMWGVPDPSKPSNSSQQANIASMPWALVASQQQNLQSLIVSDQETGSSTRPPKLQFLEDYATWKVRFKHILTELTPIWDNFSLYNMLDQRRKTLKCLLQYPR